MTCSGLEAQVVFESAGQSPLAHGCPPLHRGNSSTRRDQGGGKPLVSALSDLVKRLLVGECWCRSACLGPSVGRNSELSAHERRKAAAK